MKVPIVNCNAAARSELEIAQDIDSALSSVGFMAVQNLGVAPERIFDLFSTARAFFGLPEEAKQRCAYMAAAENFGYQGLGQESLDPDRPGDM